MANNSLDVKLVFNESGNSLEDIVVSILDNVYLSHVEQDFKSDNKICTIDTDR